MKINTPTIHIYVSTGDGVNGIPHAHAPTGIVIFDPVTDYRVYINPADDEVRRQILYSFMSSEELERFTAR